MPKVVDHDERRRAIAEAVFRLIGSSGMESVSLRDVAIEAGVSVGSVQHYFESKTEMLLFALSYMRERVLERLLRKLGKLTDPTKREYIRAVMSAMLPLDQPSREEASVNVAFFSVALSTPQFANLIAEGYARLMAMSQAQLHDAAATGQLAANVDPDKDGAALFFLVQGLIGPLLIGQLSKKQALGILDYQLDRVFVS